MSCLNQFGFSFQLPAKTATCYQILFTRFIMQLLYLLIDAVESGASEPVGLLCFFDQPFQFLNPVSRQPPHNHVLNCLHHLTFLPALPPAAKTNTFLVSSSAHAVHTRVKQNKAVVSFHSAGEPKKARLTTVMHSLRGLCCLQELRVLGSAVLQKPGESERRLCGATNLMCDTLTWIINAIL